MPTLNQSIVELEGSSSIRFDRLVTICQRHFEPRHGKGSHLIFKTPWPGDPRINLQPDGGDAKKYQIRQVLAALKKLRAMEDEGKAEQ